MTTRRLNEHVARAAHTALALQYPLLFKNYVPLKIGIDRDLQARHSEMSRTFIKRWFNWYTRSNEYLQVMAESTDRCRYGIDGPDGSVTAEAAAHAALLLHYRAKKKAKTKKAA